jgi:outer membrane immunogenic protein
MWTGFYIGLNAGGTWSSNNSVDVDSLAINNPAFVTAPLASLPAALGATADIPVGSRGGFIGGGQVGYNYQFGPSLVAGIEADIQGIAGSTGSANTFSSQLTGVPGNFVDTSLLVDRRLDYLGTVRGRLGWLVTPTLLLFGDGGLAYGGINADTLLTQSLVGPATIGVNTPYFSRGSINETRVGWTAGGGVEWMFLPNWSLKVEYLYYSLGSVTFNNGLASNVITIAPFTGQTFYAIGTQSSTRFNGNIVRAGINYHFNWAPPPVVAKY